MGTQRLTFDFSLPNSMPFSGSLPQVPPVPAPEPVALSVENLLLLFTAPGSSALYACARQNRQHPLSAGVRLSRTCWSCSPRRVVGPVRL